MKLQIGYWTIETYLFPDWFPDVFAAFALFQDAGPTKIFVCDFWIPGIGGRLLMTKRHYRVSTENTARTTNTTVNLPENSRGTATT